jgi:threonine/homoserine/homoserine lactone efflux protein
VNIALAAGLGFTLGVVTGLPLGVINVSIVEAASSQRRRLAVGIGFGGGLADTAHAALAFIGVGRLVTARPDLVRILALSAAALIVSYAVLAWRRSRAPQPERLDDDSRLLHGVAIGAMLTLPNPAALAAWVAVATALLPAATVAQAVAVGLGVGAGSALWFSLLAVWVSRIRSDHPLLRALPRVAIVALLGIAVFGVARVMI